MQGGLTFSVMPDGTAPPTHIVAGAAVTVNGIIASCTAQPLKPAEYIMLQVPAPTPVTIPVTESTVAIEVLELDHAAPSGNIRISQQ